MDSIIQSLESEYKDLPPGLLAAIMQAESGGNPNAINRNTATGEPSIGLMQFQPKTAEAYGIDPTDVNQSLKGAAAMLTDLHKQFGGDLDKVLAGYNWGSGNMAKYGMDKMPRETRDYIAKVKGMLPKQYAAAEPQTMIDMPQDSVVAEPSFSQSEQELLLLAQARKRRAQEQTAQPQQEQEKGNPFVETFKHGVQSAKDFATMDYKDPLDEKAMPALAEFRKKYQDGTWTRIDLQRAFLESMENNPGGKFLSTLSGVIPEFNILTTALNEWVNPAIEKATGADPSTIALAQLAGGTALGGAKMIKDGSFGPKANLLEMSPITKGAVEIAKPVAQKIAYPFLNPIESSSYVIKATTRPIVEKIIDSTNPITGSKGLKEALESPEAIEGQRLASKFGIDMTAGELTGQPRFRGLEDALANSARWSERFTENNIKKTDAIINRFNNVLDKIYDKPTSSTDVGVNISSAYNNTIGSLIKTRREQAKLDFGTAYEGAGEAGKYIQSNNLFRTLQELKDEGSARLLTPSKEEGGALASKLLDKLSVDTKKGNKMADTITMEELGNGLSDFSAAARRPGGAFEDAKTAAQRRVYARLYDALLKDLDAEITNPKGDPQKAAMLSVARNNFKDFSNKIADIEKTTIGKMVGEAARDSDGNLIVSPEKIAQRINSMEPTEIGRTFKFLDESHPEVSNMVRRYIVEQALIKAMEGKGQRDAGGTKAFPKAEFVKSLPNDHKLNAIFGDKAIKTDIIDTAAALNRLIDWSATKSGSQTAQRTDILNILKKLPDSIIAKAIETDGLAEYLIDPVKRAKIRKETEQVNRMVEDGKIQPPRGPLKVKIYKKKGE